MQYAIRDTQYSPTALYICRERSTNQLFIMQNEPNFQKSQVNVTFLITVAYENKSNWTLGENEPNTNPISKARKCVSLGNVADLNTDGPVDYTDMMLFTDKWLFEEVLLAEDLNRDGFVSFIDFAIFANNWAWEQ